ncbi:MAG TPA: DinB family protein [Chitinophagaceae bacterium]|jgi:uncharacterized damage-inducible protein DinB
MKITELTAQHITEVFEGGNWTDVNMRTTLSDINYREATTVTKASYNTIAALVYHISFYNEIVLKRLQGINPEISDANGFDLPPVKDENDWRKLKERCFQSAHDLAEAVKKFPEEKLGELTVTGHSTNYKTLHGVAEHAHYHLGQIVLLKKLVRNRAPQFAMGNSL